MVLLLIVWPIILKEVINYYNQKFNIKTPVEEEPPKEEVIISDEATLPEIPDASTFVINVAPKTKEVKDIGASFFGAAPTKQAPEASNIPVIEQTPDVHE